MKQLKDYTIEELKVTAFDSMAEIRRLQNNVAIIERELAERSQMPSAGKDVKAKNVKPKPAS